MLARSILRGRGRRRRHCAGETETDRERQRGAERDSERQRETERDRERQRETEGERQRQRQLDRDTEDWCATKLIILVLASIRKTCFWLTNLSFRFYWILTGESPRTI
jgi:hypothetical protein